MTSGIAGLNCSCRTVSRRYVVVVVDVFLVVVVVVVAVVVVVVVVVVKEMMAGEQRTSLTNVQSGQWLLIDG